MMFGKSLIDLLKDDNPEPDVLEFLKYYKANLPVTTTDCLVNKICNIFEDFDNTKYEYPDFDSSILKSDIVYTDEQYNLVQSIYEQYGRRVQQFSQDVKTFNISDDERIAARNTFRELFIKECYEICPNKYVLCNIVIDLCYSNNKSKQFAWDLCGDVIVENLLKKNNMKITYPEKDDNGDITYCGYRFSMKEKLIKGGDLV